MSGVLTVDGTAYDQSARKSNSLIVDAYAAWDLDSDGWLEFHEYRAGWQPKFSGPKTVSYTDAGGTLRFTGDVVSIQPGWSDEGRTWGYRCQGLKYRCNLLPVVGVDGANTLAYNLRLQDEDYLASNAGKSLGDVLSDVLAKHATALSGAGVSTDATTTAQLATFTVVPCDPVYVQGERLIDAVEWVLRTYAPYARLVLQPDGKVRFVDTAAGTAHTLTLGADPVEPPLLSRDWSSCGTRIVVRGKGRIYPAVVSISDGDLQPAWTAAQQSAWTIADFDEPADAYDYGTVTTTGGPTSITVKSHNGATTWAANFWNDRQAWVYLEKTSAVGLQYKESRPVTACTALAAGGTSVLTLGLPLDNSAATAWDTYKIVGKAGGLAEGRNNVYRLFNVVTPGAWIEQHLVKQFPQPVPFIGLNNMSAQLVSSPTSMVLFENGHSVPATFRVIPSTGQILFDRPYVESINQPADLVTGGSAVKQADDLVVLLAYSRGALQAPYPADVSGSPSYGGTAYTSAGLQRTLYADVDTWVYDGNVDQMTALAQALHRSRCDTVVSGTVVYKGLYADVLAVGTGHLLNFAATCGATGDESLNAPVRAVVVKLATGGGGLLATTEMSVSSRRDLRTSEGMYKHLSQYGSGISLGGELAAPGASFAPADLGGFGGAEGDGGSGGFPALDFGGGVNRYRRPRRRTTPAIDHRTVEEREEAGAKVKADGLAKARNHAVDLESARKANSERAEQRSAAAAEERATIKARDEQHDRDLEAARARSRQEESTRDLLASARGEE